LLFCGLFVVIWQEDTQVPRAPPPRSPSSVSSTPASSFGSTLDEQQQQQQRGDSDNSGSTGGSRAGMSRTATLFLQREASAPSSSSSLLENVGKAGQAYSPCLSSGVLVSQAFVLESSSQQQQQQAVGCGGTDRTQTTTEPGSPGERRLLHNHDKYIYISTIKVHTCELAQ
jgi:hypothetical protein